MMDAAWELLTAPFILFLIGLFAAATIAVAIIDHRGRKQ